MRHDLTLVLLWWCLGCTASTSKSTPPLAPCAPGDLSWGCRSASQAPQSNVGATGGPGTVPQQPVSASGQPSPPTSPSPAAAATAPSAAPVPSATPLPQAAADDPINRADMAFQRQRATVVFGELIAALDASNRARVERLPMTFDPDRNDVNAFASCTKSGKAAIAITDGMLILSAYLAQLQAADEVTGARHFDEYVVYVAKNQKSNAPPLPPPANWVTVEARLSPTKSARQSLLNDEIFAFVMAHELAHHYLNHLPCTSILPLDASEIGILLTDAVPAFNQPNEVAADVAGIRNVLQAGRRRANAQLTEGGATLMMRFFRGLDQASPGDVFNFERTHPPPSLREPVVQSAAQTFRATGGFTLPW